MTVRQRAGCVNQKTSRGRLLLQLHLTACAVGLLTHREAIAPGGEITQVRGGPGNPLKRTSDDPFPPARSMAARFVRHVNAHSGLACAVAVYSALRIPHSALDFTRSANGKATALTAKNAKNAKKAQAFFFKEQAFAVLCVLGVLCGSGLCRCRCRCRLLRTGFARKCSCKNMTYVFRPPPDPPFWPFLAPF